MLFQPKRPPHPYLFEEAWDLQKQVAWLRRRCALVRTGICRQTVAGVIYEWREGAQSGGLSSSWLRDAQVTGALYMVFVWVFLQVRSAYTERIADDDAFAAADKLLCRRLQFCLRLRILVGTSVTPRRPLPSDGRNTSAD